MFSKKLIHFIREEFWSDFERRHLKYLLHESIFILRSCIVLTFCRDFISQYFSESSEVSFLSTEFLDEFWSEFLCVRLLKLLDMSNEMYRATPEVVTVIILREGDIEGNFISDLRTDQVFLESWDK